jgi:hypothetical protein
MCTLVPVTFVAVTLALGARHTLLQPRCPAACCEASDTFTEDTR